MRDKWHVTESRHVGSGDRGHDDHPDVMTAPADLGLDVRRDDRGAIVLREAALEVPAGDSQQAATSPPAR